MSGNLLTNIRIKDRPILTAKQLILQYSTCLIFGILLGIIAKYSDTVSSNDAMGIVFGPIKDITTRLGIWVALATIIAVWSRSPIIAAIKVFLFFAGMLIAYYIYSQALFGFFPTYYFIRWGAIALVSPLAAYIVWFSRGKGWLAAICAALPIGLLLAQGYMFFYVPSVELGFDILAAVLLLILLPRPQVQYLRVVPLSLLVAYILRNSNILSYLFGGL